MLFIFIILDKIYTSSTSNAKTFVCFCCRSSYGERGLKSRYTAASPKVLRRSSYGERGLKFIT